MTYHDLPRHLGGLDSFPLIWPSPHQLQQDKLDGIRDPPESDEAKVYTSLVFLIHGFRSVKICEASEHFCEP